MDVQPAPLRVLFICRQNRRRSATAERIFAKDPTLDVRSAGTARDALVPVNGRMLDWADVIFTMDGDQKRSLERHFPDHAALQRVICLEIPDHYLFLDPELVSLLEDRASRHLDKLRGS
ncbi:MAG TPA: hypothetical protein VH458_10420 [Vicinamibacterales bacterium]|jgi:predicted protein tyrosine phosphatase